MSPVESEDIQALVKEIKESPLLNDENFKREIITFVESLNRVDKESPLTTPKAELTNDQIRFLTSVLVKALNIKNSTVKRKTIKLLEDLGDLAIDAIPKLIELTHSSTEHKLIRIYTAQALASIGLTKYEQVEQLIDSIEDPNPKIQQNIVIAISKLGKKAAPAIPKLQKVLSSKNGFIDEEVPVAVIICFGEMEEEAKEVAFLLGEYLKPGKSTGIRSAAAQSLARIGEIPKTAISDLISGLDPEKEERDDLRRIAFVGALAKSKSHLDKITHELSRFIEDKDLEVHVTQALAQINSGASAEVLIKALLKKSDASLSNPLHEMTLGGKWELKSEVILSVINQENRSVQSYSNLEFPHLFYAMLPPSGKNILDTQNKANVESLCQILISKALEHQTNKNLFIVITQIIAIGSRLEKKDLKSQIDKYQFSNSLKADDLYELRSALGDTSILETEISELNAQLNNSLKKYLEALNTQGTITLSQTEVQFNEILWMNRFIFIFGFVVGTVSVVYFFYNLFSGGEIDILKTVISLFGSVAGIGSAFLILFYKPQKQGQEAINNLSKSNVILGGFVFEMAHIAESLAKLQSQNNLDFDQVRVGSEIIRKAYSNALIELQNINKDLSDG